MIETEIANRRLWRYAIARFERLVRNASNLLLDEAVATFYRVEAPWIELINSMDEPTFWLPIGWIAFNYTNLSTEKKARLKAS